LKAALYRFWLARAPRERWALLAGAAALVLGALYFALLLPVTESTRRMAQRMPALERELALMRLHAAELPALRKAPPRAATLPADIAAQARRFELDLSVHGDSAATQEPRLRLDGSGLRFDRLLAWLDALQREQGWRVAEMRLAQVANGRVNADIMLTRP
jgi:type II secretory pathway component PulM